MTNPLNYPLEQLMTIKKNRFDQAVKTLEEKKAILEKAYEILYDLTQERDEVLRHKTEKLTQLRQALDEGLPTNKLQQMKVYLQVVDEQLAAKNKKVATQQQQVDLAQKQVDLATDDLFQKKRDLEKMELHKKEWEKEVHHWTERKEAVEHDELGSATFQIRKREEEMRRKQREQNEEG
jgi:flagellar biosynthesis chaperone FliJ